MLRSRTAIQHTGYETLRTNSHVGKLVDEAVKQTAEEPLGTVVAGDFIYEDLCSELLQSGVLPQDIDTR